jgi:hypothetical protein
VAAPDADAEPNQVRQLLQHRLSAVVDAAA